MTIPGLNQTFTLAMTKLTKYNSSQFLDKQTALYSTILIIYLAKGFMLIFVVFQLMKKNGSTAK
jgi:hypothetical protein